MCCMYTVYSGMQEWVIQIPSIPILVSVLFPSLHLKYFRITFLLLVYIYYRCTSDRSNFALRRSARRLTAHAHRCVKLKQGRVSDKARCAPSLVFLCVLDGIVLSIKLTRLLGYYW